MDYTHGIEIKAGARKWGGPGVVDNSTITVFVAKDRIYTPNYIDDAHIFDFVDANVAHHG